MNNGKYIHCLWESKSYNISSCPPFENCLFRAVSVTKHVNIGQYKYSGYGIIFHRKGEFSIGNGCGRNVIIWGQIWVVLFMLITKLFKTILVLGKNFVQTLNNTTIYTDKLNSISFTENNKKYCLSLHYNGANSYLFVNCTEIY